MWPLLAGLAARIGGGAVARTAVTSAAESGAISAGAGATSGSRMLSAAQFANAGSRLVGANQTAQPRPTEAPAGDGLGWMRS
ncbi:MULTISPECIES: hypothetical protein [unclassified Streptomyces]|uniref:hypothetical protein n=1 Tax=unclassified Streptomyces TaxID=2593676 RepID=UPI003D912527